jgi:transcriptional regulator with XRE-family HTH domain
MKNQENISPIDQYVIDFVRRLRIKRSLTQDGLASILGVGKSFISNTESLNHPAKYNLTHINALADYFSLKPGDFLPEKAIPVNSSKAEKKRGTSPESGGNLPVTKNVGKVLKKR